MAEMATAARAKHFGAYHPVAHIARLIDVTLRGRLGEARPAAAGIKFRIGFEQRLSAPGADIGAGPACMLVFARERAFGGLLAQHGVLHGRQFLAPLGLALFDFWGCFGIRHGTSLVNRLLSTVDLRLASVSPRLLIAYGNKTAVESHIPLALTFVNKLAARSDRMSEPRY